LEGGRPRFRPTEVGQVGVWQNVGEVSVPSQDQKTVTGNLPLGHRCPRDVTLDSVRIAATGSAYALPASLTVDEVYSRAGNGCSRGVWIAQPLPGCARPSSRAQVKLGQCAESASKKSSWDDLVSWYSATPLGRVSGSAGGPRRNAGFLLASRSRVSVHVGRRMSKNLQVESLGSSVVARATTEARPPRKPRQHPGRAARWPARQASAN